ncbi:MAG: hypothetical protein ACI4XL_12645 [Bacillus sp. (in: firmicutes)]
MDTEVAHFQFLFPFLLNNGRRDEMKQTMLDKGYDFFNLKDLDQENRFYGKHTVSHRRMEQFFLPNIEKILFPSDLEDDRYILRFSKVLNLKGEFTAKFVQTDFVIPSIDIILCPFNIGIMTIRVETRGDLTYTEAMEFGNLFRKMESIGENDSSTIVVGEDKYERIKDFIFECLSTELRQFIHEDEETTPYFGSLPFFMDERMYAISFIYVNPEEDISKEDLYRIGHLYGFDEKGNPYIGASNPKFLDRYYEAAVFDRWADETYYGISEYAYFCLTKSEDPENIDQLMDEMYGKHYYSVLLYYFYKITLMKLMHNQSLLSLAADTEKIEDNIFEITRFSANYYFPEVNSSSFGKDTFNMVKDVFQIEVLHSYLQNSLETLYQNHERLESRRTNYLLQVLTIYSVISGMLGMNLVIDNLENGLSWQELSKFSAIEMIVLVLVLSAVVISFVMGYFFAKKWVQERRKKRHLSREG